MSVETVKLPHLPRIQTLRGVAAVLVLLAHLSQIESWSSPDRIMGDWALWGFAGVDLFFVISGFIMVYVTWGVGGGPKDAGRFLWRRATRIYPLYWVVSSAVLAAWLLRPGLVFGSNPDPDILRSFLLLPDQSLPLLTVGWTLVFEMYFYVVFALALLLPGKWQFPVIVVWAVAAQSLDPPGSGPVLELVFSPLVREFLFGGLIAWVALTTLALDPILGGGAQTGGRPRAVIALAALALLALGLLSAAGAGEGALAVAEDHALRTEAFGLPAAALVTLALLSPHSASAVGRWLGDISYSLYLTHVLVLAVLGRLWEPWARAGAWDNLVVLPAVFGSCILVGAATYYVVERPLIRWFRRRRASFASAPVAR